jgi:hypothetical protein
VSIALCNVLVEVVGVIKDQSGDGEEVLKFGKKKRSSNFLLLPSSSSRPDGAFSTSLGC